MHTRWLFILGFGVGTSFPAAASYELLLATDTAADAVFRFDASSGRALGEFGRGRMWDPVGIAADPSRGLAYVASYATGTIQTWEYSTGLLLNEWSCGGLPRGLALASNGDLLIGGNANLRRYRTNGTFVRAYGGGVFTGVGQAADGSIWGYHATAGAMARYNFDTGALLGSFTPAEPGSTAFFTLVPFGAGLMTTRSTTIYGWATADGSGAHDVATGLVDAGSIALGHGPTAYVVSGAAGSRAIVPVSTLSNLKGPAFGTGVLTTCLGMTSVVAPEPGTLTAVGLGLAALATRRRRRRG